MTLPVSRAFRNSHGLQASADVSVNSPRQSNNQANHQNVNANIISPLTKDRQITITTDETDLKPVVEKVNEQTINYTSTKTVKPPQTDDVDIKERSVDNAFKNLEEMSDIVKDKNALIQALALIIDLYQSNPLVVNKFIVAEEEVLIKLLLLLTDADEIELVKKDFDVGCMCSNPKFQYIDKIMVHKGDDLFNLKYSFPSVIRLLDNRNITIKMVC